VDIFRFMNPVNRTLMREGRLITGPTLSKMWIERYADEGEFEITALARDGLQLQLPRGCYISHVDTDEIMVVEDHQISSDRDSEPVVKITGRSFETILNRRVVGANRGFPTTSVPGEGYPIPAWYSWIQIQSLILRHIRTDLVNDSDIIPFVEVLVDASGDPEKEDRVIKRGDLYVRVKELLAVDKLGIKTVRPGPWSDTVNPDSTAIVIHQGRDRSDQISLDYHQGDIDSADYLWSDRKKKNCAYVTGKWVQTIVDTTRTGDERRMMHVEASDIDQDQTEVPTGLTRTFILAAMRARGRQEMAKQNGVALVKVDASKNRQNAIFRTDYNVGDLITISGDYAETAKMRVTEHVEIEDENGFTSYPTLSSIEGEDE
jgi:hypothetical protein